MGCTFLVTEDVALQQPVLFMRSTCSPSSSASASFTRVGADKIARSMTSKVTVRWAARISSSKRDLYHDQLAGEHEGPASPTARYQAARQ